MNRQDESTKKWINTAGAQEYAANRDHTASEVDAHWWSFFVGYRQKQWQRELRRLLQESGRTAEEIGEYTGLTHTTRTSFMNRLPRKRRSYIGIGMALGQPLETINRWIGKYGGKRRLYARDVCEDLIWIYLIAANQRDAESDTNYYRLFEPCAAAVYETYCMLWADYYDHAAQTAQVEHQVREIPFDANFDGLREYVAAHLDAFKTAYARPRCMLAERAQFLAESLDETGDGQRASLAVLRGYLDDSMINYLSGDPQTIHAVDRREEGHHLLRFKQVPKSKKSHISLALALGMCREELDTYLELMGFLPLDAVDQEEGILLNALEKWEKEHPQAARIQQGSLPQEEAREIAMERLRLRQDMGAAFEALGRKCPYLK